MEKRFLKYLIPTTVIDKIIYAEDIFWCLTHTIEVNGGILSTAVWTGSDKEIEYGYYIIRIEFDRAPIPVVKLDPGFIEKGGK